MLFATVKYTGMAFLDWQLNTAKNNFCSYTVFNDEGTFSFNFLIISPYF
jgi:hypothetical protein